METMTVIFEGTLTFPMGYASSKHKKEDRNKKTDYQALSTMSGKFIIPGEQLAGGLRRAGMDDIRAAFPEEPFNSILSFYQARVGGVAGFGKIYKMGELANLRRINPLLSLWGKAGVRGHIGMGHAVGPVTETIQVLQGKNGDYNHKSFNSDRVHGFRSDDLSRDPGIDLPVDFWHQREVLNMAGKSPEKTVEVAAYAENADFFGFPLPAGNAQEDMAVTTDNEDGGKDKPGKLTNVQNGYGGFEYLPNDTQFAHRFTVTGTKPELLMLMASFCGFAKNPRLGGHWRHNMGWVDMQYNVYVREDDPRLAPREVGAISINSYMDDLITPALQTTGMVSEWMDAYRSLWQQRFPGIDINAGAEDERKVIEENLKKILKNQRDNSAKKATNKKSSDQQTAENEEENHVA